MKPDISNKSVIVYGYGDSIPMAMRLSRDFGKVMYAHPSWQDDFPVYNKRIIGNGIEGVERIYDFWSKINEADLIVIPDLFLADVQQYLRGIGKPVFGAGWAEELEIFRGFGKEELSKSGLPVGKYKSVIGIDKLKETLKEEKDRYIKINGYLRGHNETWHHENYDLSKPVLDEMEHLLSVGGEDEEFIIEEPVDSIPEIGYDGAFVNGEFLPVSVSGIEIKDSAWVGQFIKYSDLPEPIRMCNDTMKEILSQYDYRGWYSNEIRISKSDKKPYLTDQTIRQPCPPGFSELEAYDNYSEMIWEIANGRMPEVEYSKKYWVEVIIKSDWAQEEVQPLYFPNEIAKWVKIKNLVVVDGVSYYVPQRNGMKEIGSLVFGSNSLEDAFLEIKYMAKQIKGYQININIDVLDEAVDKIKELKAEGINLINI